jgi:3-oxoacyl-[acyl-carrier-protein] synthase-3
VGNTSAASIPIALDEAVSRNLVHRGDRLLLSAFGAGLTWAAALYEW